MTRATVMELPLMLEPVAPDPFIADLGAAVPSAAAVGRPRRAPQHEAAARSVAAAAIRAGERRHDGRRTAGATGSKQRMPGCHQRLTQATTHGDVRPRGHIQRSQHA